MFNLKKYKKKFFDKSLVKKIKLISLILLYIVPVFWIIKKVYMDHKLPFSQYIDLDFFTVFIFIGVYTIIYIVLIALFNWLKYVFIDDNYLH